MRPGRRKRKRRAFEAFSAHRARHRFVMRAGGLLVPSWTTRTATWTKLVRERGLYVSFVWGDR